MVMLDAVSKRGDLELDVGGGRVGRAFWAGRVDWKLVVGELRVIEVVWVVDVGNRPFGMVSAQKRLRVDVGGV